jgi:hypothetical protein
MQRKAQRPIMRRKAQRLEKPYPPTAPIPDVGLTLFNVGWAKAYSFARRGIIETMETGERGKLGLVHKTCVKLGVNPNHD